MSEQTTAPTERDELATLITRTRHVRALHLELPASIINHVTGGIAEAILAAGYRKPRTVTTVEELDALPAGTLIACLNLNPDWPSVFLNAGGSRTPWLHLDPGDRSDGETTLPSGEVLRWYGKGSAIVLREGDSNV